MSSSARGGVASNNNVSDPVTKDDRQQGGGGVRCCCVSFLLILVSVSTVSGILVWVLNRTEQSESQVSEVLSSDAPNLSEHISDEVVIQSELSIESFLEPEVSDQVNFPPKKSDNIVFPRERMDFVVHEAVETSSTTPEKPKSTTLEPRYTEIITKMKEMRKNRLSNRFGSSLRPLDNDEDGAEELRNTSPMSINLWTTKSTTTSTTTTTTTISEIEEELFIEDDMIDEEDVLIDDDLVTEVSEIISEDTTEDDAESDLDKLKTSKFLRFEKEIELAYKKRTERNHNINRDEVPSSNDIAPKQDSDEEVGVKNEEIVSSTTKTTSSENTKTASQSFFAYPDTVAIKTYTIDPDTEQFGKYPQQCKMTGKCMKCAPVVVCSECAK